MTNAYLNSVAITEEREARVLGSPSGWEVLQELRSAGLEGRTAEELSEELTIPISTVYNALKELRAAGYIETRRLQKRLGRPSKQAQEEEKKRGKQKRIYVEKIQWGEITFDSDFAYVLDTVVSKVVEDSDIAKTCSDLIDKIFARLSILKEKEILPSSDNCPVCKENHEALEFVWALLMYTAHKVIKSEELEAVGKKYKYEI